MEDVLEICPGVYAVPDGLCVCPGCGCPAVGLDASNPQDVVDWYKATFAVLRDLGVAWATEEAAAEDAASYNRRPWHDPE